MAVVRRHFEIRYYAGVGNETPTYSTLCQRDFESYWKAFVRRRGTSDCFGVCVLVSCTDVACVGAGFGLGILQKCSVPGLCKWWCCLSLLLVLLSTTKNNGALFDPREEAVPQKGALYIVLPVSDCTIFVFVHMVNVRQALQYVHSFKHYCCTRRHTAHLVGIISRKSRPGTPAISNQ